LYWVTLCGVCFLHSFPAQYVLRVLGMLTIFCLVFVLMPSWRNVRNSWSQRGNSSSGWVPSHAICAQSRVQIPRETLFFTLFKAKGATLKAQQYEIAWNTFPNTTDPSVHFCWHNNSSYSLVFLWHFVYILPWETLSDIQKANVDSFTNSIIPFTHSFARRPNSQLPSRRKRVTPRLATPARFRFYRWIRRDPGRGTLSISSIDSIYITLHQFISLQITPNHYFTQSNPTHPRRSRS
jgi:hypothetical protein